TIEAGAQKEVKKVNDKIFVIDHNEKTVYNESNVSFNDKQYEAYEPQRFEVRNWQIVKEAVKSSLSREKLQKTSKKSFGLIINCDYDGNIESIEFMFPKDIFLSVEEIAKIESNLKNRKFQVLAHAKKEQDGIQLGIPCRMGAFLK
ncbi:MAG: hypothetical protein K2H72_03815, partial [Muribaculaceae bacterium]|nr:hypothetical protein [Muribaculaceae bacterium]